MSFYIDTAQLAKHSACSSKTRLFHLTFGERAEITHAAVRKALSVGLPTRWPALTLIDAANDAGQHEISVEADRIYDRLADLDWVNDPTPAQIDEVYALLQQTGALWARFKEVTQ